jgi:hypothetical protein
VKSFAVHGLLALLCVAVFSAGAGDDNQHPAAEAAQSKIRIGLINLDVTGGDAALATKANDAMAQALGDIGFYKVYTQPDLEKAFESIKQKFPARCRDPRCVAAIGSALGLDRMMYGNLDKSNNRFGISLILLEVQSTQVTQRVNMETPPGVALADVVKAAVSRLHGLSSG